MLTAAPGFFVTRSAQTEEELRILVVGYMTYRRIFFVFIKGYVRCTCEGKTNVCFLW